MTKDLIFTDAKFDDILAIQIYVMRASSESLPVTVVLTNIVNKGPAAALLKHCFGISVLIADDGVVNIKPKSHEPMYAKWSDNSIELEDYPRDFHYDSVFMLSPIDSVCYPTLQNAGTVYMGLGYNTAKLSYEFITSLKNLVVVNNMSRTVYIDKDGGRFESNDNDVWSNIDKANPTLKMLRQDALEDSVEFIVRQSQKSGIDGITRSNMFSDDILTKAIAAKDSHRYMPRIIDQLKRKQIDVETTDGQHMALWLGATDRFKHIDLQKGESFITLAVSESPTNVRAPCGIKWAEMRDLFIQITKQ